MSEAVLTNETRKARKVHKCSHCRELIGKGEQYKYITNTCDGSVCTWHYHLECREAINKDKNFPYEDAAHITFIRGTTDER